MGPLHLADLIGFDTVTAMAQAMYEEFKELCTHLRCCCEPTLTLSGNRRTANALSPAW